MAAPPSGPTRWALRVGGAFDTGTLPRPAPGVAVAFEARRGSFAAGISASGFVPQAVRAAGEPPVLTTVGLVDAMATACLLVPATRAVEVGGCAGAGAGILFGETGGISRPGSGVGIRPQGIALGRLDARLSRLAGLHVDLGPLVDPVRSPFRVAGLGEVYRPPAVALRAGVGFQVQW